MLTALQRSGGIEALARQTEVETSRALALVKEILPEMLDTFGNMAGGRAALLAVFEQFGGTGLAAEVMAMERADPAPGKIIVERAVGEGASALPEIAARSGPSGARLLPLLAMLVGGYVTAAAAGHGPGPQGLESLLSSKR